MFWGARSMTYRNILLGSVLCLFGVLVLSAAGLVINLWLGFERNLAGNLGAVVITALLICRWKDLPLLENKWLALYLSVLCGIGAVLFLILLAGLSPVGAYSFDSLSFAEAALAFLVNALVFIGTVKVVCRQGKTT